MPANAVHYDMLVSVNLPKPRIWLRLCLPKKPSEVKGELRDDIPGRHLAFSFLGSLRLLVKHWTMSGYAFDLQQEALSVWNSWKTLLAPVHDTSKE